MDPERLRRGVAALEGLGFRVRIPDGIGERRGLTAGTVDQRVAEVQALVADDEVAAIVCARGGEGAGWLLPRLDAELVRSRPKVFVGYSDITYLHLLFDRLGIVSFHGPMVCFGFSDGAYDRERFLSAVTAEGRLYASEPEDLLPLRPGAGEGRLRGGCLSLLAGAAGTSWALAPEEDGSILFLEDKNERPYRIDRMIFQLRQSGALAGVRGVVFGDMVGCTTHLDEPYSLEDVLLEALAGLDIPVAMGLSSGHTTSPNVTLPLGVRARLTCTGEEARFEILETAVS